MPSWHEAPDPDAANLMLDPGLAFGTGTHPTTALCLQWLDGQDVQDKQVIDYGCGSGILGLAALLLGAGTWLAWIPTPKRWKPAATMLSVTALRPAGWTCYLPESEPDTRADIMLANILAQPLIGLAPHLAARDQTRRRSGAVRHPVQSGPRSHGRLRTLVRDGRTGTERRMDTAHRTT